MCVMYSWPCLEPIASTSWRYVEVRRADKCVDYTGAMRELHARMVMSDEHYGDAWCPPWTCCHPIEVALSDACNASD